MLWPPKGDNPKLSAKGNAGVSYSKTNPSPSKNTATDNYIQYVQNNKKEQDSC